MKISGDGEDHIVLNNGKLSDVRGFRKFPFLCQFNYPPIPTDNYECPPCEDFIDTLPINSIIVTILQNGLKFCKNQLANFFGTKAPLMCDMLSEFLSKGFEKVEEKFIDSYEICKLPFLKHCNLVPMNTTNDNCIRCKHYATQLKKMSFGISLDQHIGKYLPYVTHFITYLCSELSVDCKNLNFNEIITGLFLFKAEENNFPSTLCSSIGLCN